MCPCLIHYVLPVSIHSSAPSTFSEATSIIEKRRKKHVGVENENEGERWQQGACIKKTTDDQ
jgi:hypothetical protein